MSSADRPLDQSTSTQYDAAIEISLDEACGPSKEDSSSVIVPAASRRDKRDDSDRPEHERTLSIVGLAFVTFLAVCGGPFGIETAVGAGGPLLTIVGILSLAVLWELPQALMTAEMSTVFPSNAGYIAWVMKGAGPFFGFLNSFNALASNLFDLPVYPVLIANYATQLFGASRGGIMDWSIKGGALLVVVVVNVLGMDAVATSSVGFALLVFLPFVVQLFMVKYEPSRWVEVPETIQWGPFVSTILWAVQGFDTMGCLAGEVKNAKRTFPIGVSAATVLITANYVLPILVGSAVAPNFSHWEADATDGQSAPDPDAPDSGGVNLAVIGSRIAPWMGVAVLASASLANLAQFSAVVSASSRALQHIADYGMLPKILAWTHPTRKSPVAAILAQSVIVGCLMAFDFSELVQLDIMFNNISLLIEITTFLYLKHKFPLMHRPYALPGGIPGAWIASLPKIFVILTVIVLVAITEGGWFQIVVCLATNVVLVVAALYWVRCTPAGRAWAPAGTDMGSPTEAAAETTSLLAVTDLASLRKPSDLYSVASADAAIPTTRFQSHDDLLAGGDPLDDMSGTWADTASQASAPAAISGGDRLTMDDGISLPDLHRSGSVEP